jgi:hypothetical protein
MLTFRGPREGERGVAMRTLHSTTPTEALVRFWFLEGGGPGPCILDVVGTEDGYEVVLRFTGYLRRNLAGVAADKFFRDVTDAVAFVRVREQEWLREHPEERAAFPADP